MPVYQPSAADSHEMHGSRFHSFVRTNRGGGGLCAWRLEVGAGVAGVAHRPTHEEVMLVLGGTLQIGLDGAEETATAGCVVHVPAGAELRLDGGPEGATVWVTTTAGCKASVAGHEIAPPWAQ